MYKVIFKGDLEPIYLSPVEGKQLMDDLKAGKLQGFIELNGQMVDSKSIKAVIPDQVDPDSQEKKSEFTEMVHEENRKFREWRAERLKMSPEKRAESTSFMNYMSQALRGRTLNHREVLEVREKQKEFFESHPDFHTANPTCFFTKQDLAVEDENLPMMPIKTALKIQALKYAELHLNAF